MTNHAQMARMNNMGPQAHYQKDAGRNTHLSKRGVGVKTFDHHQNRGPEMSDHLRYLSNQANIVNRMYEVKNKDSGYINPNSVSMIDMDAPIFKDRMAMKR